MSENNTFFLLDGHAIAYRAFFGMQNRRFQTRQGLPTGAVYGFTRILFDLIRTYNPRLLAVCFDTKDPTHRHEVYDSYKGHRKPAPDDLVLQFPYMQQMVEALGIPLFRESGYEADDLIGTLAKKAGADNFQVRIITGDRDLFQLIDDQIRVLLPARKEPGKFEDFGASEVQEKYGYTPEQVIDFKALAGDASDNIPGVAGIGEKSALTLLKDFVSLEQIYTRLEEVPAKWQKKLVAGRESALLSQQLATILLDAPAQFNAEQCLLSEPDMPVLLELLKTLEFSSIQKELPGVLAFFTGTKSDLEELETLEQARQLRPDVIVPENLEAVKNILPELQEYGFAFDTETTGLNCLHTDLVGISLAYAKEGEILAYYLPVGHRLIQDLEAVLPLTETLALLKPIFEDPDCPKCAHNAKFDINVLSQYSVHVQGVSDDTMLMDYLIQPESRHGLKEMALSYLNLEMQPIKDLIGSGRKQITMDQVAIEDASVYAAADAVATWKLREKLAPELNDKTLKDLYTQIEMPLQRVLATIEQKGVKLDTDFLTELSQKLDQQLRELEGNILQSSGENFNLNSPLQLSKVLFETLNLPSKGIKKNKNGAFSTDVKTLEKLRPFNPVIDQILDYRQLSKLKSTYVDALPLLINPKTGRLHTTYHQAVASTGRLSSSDPNLQNIPIRTELGRQMRRAFIVSSPDMMLASFDYSQIELRLLAHFSEDPPFVEAFCNDRDIHAQTAVDIFNLESLENVSTEMRRIAKTTNFGIVYGQSAYGLASTLNIPNQEASKIIKRFKERYVGIEDFMQQTLDFARKNGYVETLLHRRRNLEDINHPNRNIREFNERAAINSPLQGSASDLIKLAMIQIQNWIQAENLPVSILMQVHDELVFEMPEGLLSEMVPKIKQQMEDVYSLKVPLKVDVHTGSNWMEAK